MTCVNDAADADVAPAQHPHQRLSRSQLQQRLILAGIAVTGSAMVLFRSPTAPGAYPPCPVWAITGCYCPGCGSMRAVASLLRGDFAAAVSYNILLFPALIWMAWWFVAPWTGRPAPSSKWGIIISALLVVVYTVVRNLPGSPLAP